MTWFHRSRPTGLSEGWTAVEHELQGTLDLEHSMAFNILVADAGRLPPGVEFPPLAADRYGWEQYLELRGEALVERCWRAQCLVLLNTPIGAADLERMPRLELLVAAAGACKGLDQPAVQARGIRVQTFADADLGDAAGAEALCGRIAAAIDAFIAGR